MKCTACAGEQLAPGFVADNGEGARGYARWIDGELETGMFGGARQMGRPWAAVQGFRCLNCGHLDLYASTPD